MKSASKTTLSQNNFKILRTKVRKNLTNLRKKFFEFPPRAFVRVKALNKHIDEIDPRLEGPTLLAPGPGPRRVRPRNLVIEGSCNYFFWMEKIAMVRTSVLLTFYQNFESEFK